MKIHPAEVLRQLIEELEAQAAAEAKRQQANWVIIQYNGVYYFFAEANYKHVSSHIVLTNNFGNTSLTNIFLRYSQFAVTKDKIVKSRLPIGYVIAGIPKELVINLSDLVEVFINYCEHNPS